MPGVVMGHHRRYPHLTRADVETLDALRAEKGAEAARDYERLLEAQHRDAVRHDQRHVLFEHVEGPSAGRCAA